MACLVGHEEGNPRLQLDEDLVRQRVSRRGKVVEAAALYRANWGAGMDAGDHAMASKGEGVTV